MRCRRAPGLTDSLSLPRGGRLPVHQVTPTLWVLTAGRAVPDPMSLLVSPAMKQLLDDARDAFDWVVVDTPPIAILPDANLLAAMIDTALLVVSAQSTPYPMVQRAAEAIGTNRILGVVLNRADKAGLPANYGYYGDTYSRRPAASPRRAAVVRVAPQTPRSVPPCSVRRGDPSCWSPARRCCWLPPSSSAASSIGGSHAWELLTDNTAILRVLLIVAGLPALPALRRSLRPAHDHRPSATWSTRLMRAIGATSLILGIAYWLFPLLVVEQGVFLLTAALAIVHGDGLAVGVRRG